MYSAQRVSDFIRTNFPEGGALLEDEGKGVGVFSGGEALGKGVRVFSDGEAFGGFAGLDNTGGLVLALVDDDRRLGPRVWFGGASEDKGAISSSSVSLSVSLPSSLLNDSQPGFAPRNLLATRRGHMISACLPFIVRMSERDHASTLGFCL
jgi:hypothetical protein